METTSEKKQEVPQKRRRLTKKERGFVKDFVATENGTQAALKNYDTKDPTVAGSIASENLKKPHIREAINAALPDEFLGKKHRELFDQKRIDYFVFPKSLSDEEIVEHVKAAGIDVITVRQSDKGKMAFYSIPDAQAMGRALEMGYKIKGAFADETKPPGDVKNTYNFIFSKEVQEEVKNMEAKIKAQLIKPHVQPN